MITAKLSGKRRIVVQEFKGNWFVNLREYYEDKSGEMKPGKKVGEHHLHDWRGNDCRLTNAQGIMLSVDQFQTLVGTVPAITKELRKHGVKIAGGNAAEDDAEEEDEDEKPARPKKESKSKKANIEATSDEAEDSD